MIVVYDTDASYLASFLICLANSGIVTSFDLESKCTLDSIILSGGDSCLGEAIASIRVELSGKDG